MKQNTNNSSYWFHWRQPVVTSEHPIVTPETTSSHSRVNVFTLKQRQTRGLTGSGVLEGTNGGKKIALNKEKILYQSCQSIKL